MLSLAFIDPSLGGSGYLPRIAEQFQAVAARAIEHLEHPGCETACYRCLKSYYNQRYHEQLAWPQIVPALEELAASAPKPRPRETGDIDDPRPWLEAYAAGVGSPLELAFLRLFEKHGFHPQKQIPVAPNPGEPPISVADFAVPERRLAIYIDGAAFHVGRLRRDKFIRPTAQGAPPWQWGTQAADLGRASRGRTEMSYFKSILRGWCPRRWPTASPARQDSTTTLVLDALPLLGTRFPLVHNQTITSADG